MNRVLKVMILIALVGALAALFIVPWATGRKGTPAGFSWDDAVGGFVGRVSAVSLKQRLLQSSATVPSVLTSVQAEYDEVGRHTKTVMRTDYGPLGRGFAYTQEYRYNRRGELLAISVRVNGIASAPNSRSEFDYDYWKHRVTVRSYGGAFGTPKPAKVNWLDRVTGFFTRKKEKCDYYTECKLDAHNELISGTTFDEKGKPLTTFTIRRDSAGRILSRKQGMYRATGGAMEVHYTRDARGDVVEEKATAYNGYGNPGWMKSSYNYDSHGNWVRRTETWNDNGKWKPYRLTERQITYY